MRIAASLLVVVLLVSSACMAGAAPRVSTARASITSANGRVVYKVKYPRISGSPADAAVNRQLQGWFVPEKAQLDRESREVEKGEVLDNEVNFQVGLVSPTLLSVAYYGLGCLMKDGHFNAAHPSKTNRAYTFDLRTGKALPLSALFKKGTDWKKKLDERLKAHNSPVDPPGQYGYYLTGKKLVLMNLSDVFAVASVEIPVPYTELTDIIDPAGPLAPLLAK